MLTNGELAGIAVIALAGLVVTLWAIIDAASTPASTFRNAGSSKALWMVLISILYFVTVYPGVITAIIYLSVIRKRLHQSAPGISQLP